jgi:hypothetical protein
VKSRDLTKWFNVFVEKIQTTLKCKKYNGASGKASESIARSEQMASGAEEQQFSLSKLHFDGTDECHDSSNPVRMPMIPRLMPSGQSGRQ